jgi:alcohol dehydrogenase (cytochrome c)
VAPLVVKGKVIIGTLGRASIRGFIAAFDAKTGRKAGASRSGKGEPGNETWAGDSWKTGGASVWVTGSMIRVDLTYSGHWESGRLERNWRATICTQPVVALDADAAS